MMKRRNYFYYKNELKIYRYMLNNKILSPLKFYILILARLVLRILPINIKLFYIIYDSNFDSLSYKNNDAGNREHISFKIISFIFIMIPFALIMTFSLIF